MPLNEEKLTFNSWNAAEKVVIDRPRPRLQQEQNKECRKER